MLGNDERFSFIAWKPWEPSALPWILPESWHYRTEFHAQHHLTSHFSPLQSPQNSYLSSVAVKATFLELMLLQSSRARQRSRDKKRSGSSIQRWHRICSNRKKRSAKQDWLKSAENILLNRKRAHNKCSLRKRMPAAGGTSQQRCSCKTSTSSKL